MEMTRAAPPGHHCGSLGAVFNANRIGKGPLKFLNLRPTDEGRGLNHLRDGCVDLRSDCQILRMQIDQWHRACRGRAGGRPCCHEHCLSSTGWNLAKFGPVSCTNPTVGGPAATLADGGIERTQEASGVAHINAGPVDVPSYDRAGTDHHMVADCYRQDGG